MVFKWQYFPHLVFLSLLIYFSSATNARKSKKSKVKSTEVYQIYPMTVSKDSYELSSESSGEKELIGQRLDKEGCGDDRTFADFEICGLYHTCKLQKDNTYRRKDHYCPDDNSFDPIKRQCTEIPCTDVPAHPAVPANWPSCPRQGKKLQIPDECHRFFICWWTGTYYTYTAHTCPESTFFDEEGQTCTSASVCPQDWLPMPSNWTCKRKKNIRQHPENCEEFYKCKQRQGKWYIHVRKCPEGQIFDQDNSWRDLPCIPGSCSDNFEPLPSGYPCNRTDDLHVHPEDCKKYYQCTKCGEEEEETSESWCHKGFQTCPNDLYFDDLKKQCVKSHICPQNLTELPQNWKCGGNGEQHVQPENCSNYYTCEICIKPRGYCYTSHTCPHGETYDDTKKACVHDSCPQDPKPIPKSWNCTKNGELHQLPHNCSAYYECEFVEQHDFYTWKDHSCPHGETFDEAEGVCVEGPCPQSRPEIGDKMTCTKELEVHVMPKDCRKYYTCHKCNKPKGWCYVENHCSKDETFDQKTKKCVKGRCPQLPPKIHEGWICNKTGERWALPENCSQFYTCLACEEGPWCYKNIQNCPAAHVFDNEAQTCVLGRCPQFPELIPQHWPVCSKEGDFYAHPDNCTFFVKCTQCPDVDAWCGTIHHCKSGETYDNEKDHCVPGRCRQWPQKLPQGWNCSFEGELSVDPTNCSQYYKCQKDCPDARWCIDTKSCPHGQSFDDKLKECVEERCPQYLPKLPEEWKCDKDGAEHVSPDNCGHYYKCSKCPDGGWCHELHGCEHRENFDDKKKVCVKGICPQKIARPEWEKLECKGWGDLGTKEPTEQSCYCYIECTSKLVGASWKQKCCRPGEYYSVEKKTCLEGECPYDMNSGTGGWISDKDNIKVFERKAVPTEATTASPTVASNVDDDYDVKPPSNSSSIK